MFETLMIQLDHARDHFDVDAVRREALRNVAAMSLDQVEKLSNALAGAGCRINETEALANAKRHNAAIDDINF